MLKIKILGDVLKDQEFVAVEMYNTESEITSKTTFKNAVSYAKSLGVKYEMA